MENITHTHDGMNSDKIKSYNVIPTFIMTSTELAKYISRPAIEGEEFNVYDRTNYYKYIMINGVWTKFSAGENTICSKNASKFSAVSPSICCDHSIKHQ